MAMAVLFAALAAAPAFAEKPSRAGGKNQSRVEDRRDDRRDVRQDARRDNRRDVRRDARRDNRRSDYRYDDRYRRDYWHSRDVRFQDHMRARIDVYYDRQARRGHCPPGLAKRGYRCVPPGHYIRRWERGRPLPRDVVYAPLPHDLLVQLPPPPLHHEYVRVASDILLIATGTAMVVDAIQDIGERR
jgi:Ni/Co efflux regulator RcnB